MNGRGLIAVILFALTLMAAGCKTIQEIKGEDALKAALRSYEASVRWGEPNQAYNFLAPEVAETAEIPADLDNVQITGYRVVSRPTHLSEHVVTQTAVIEYLFRDRQVSHALTDRQLWEFEADQQRWFRTNPIPVFK